MTIQGKLFKKFDTQQVSSSFKKRELVLEYADNPMYPQYILFQAIQDKVDLIEPLQEGQMIEVDFNLRGREWISPSGQVRYFNSLDVWKIRVLSEAPKETVVTPSEPKSIEELEVDEDDLPF